MVQRGMFVDGMFYASVARNLGTGQGSFWAPSYSGTIYREYYEQPPLGIGLESVAFTLAGDHPAVERVYSLVMFGLVAGLIVAIWRLFFPVAYDWVPLVFWVIPSVVTWAAINNMLENTQAVFTTAAVYAAIRAVLAARTAAAIRWAVGAGALVAAALLVKGPVGAFPLAVPVMCLWLPASMRRSPMVIAVMIGTVAAAVATLAALPAARHAFDEYLRTQIAPTFSHRPAVWVQVLAVARHLAGGIIGRLGVMVGIVWMCRRRDATGAVPWRAVLCLLSIALAASAPLAFSPKIAGHYMVPSVPFFALASAAIALPAVRSRRGIVAGTWGRRLPVLLGGILLALTVAVPLVHGTLEPRDLDMIASMDAIGREVPRGAVLGTCASAAQEWGLFAYTQRLLRVSIDPGDRPVAGWFLQPSSPACAPPPTCRRVAGGDRAVLYRCDTAGPG